MERYRCPICHGSGRSFVVLDEVAMGGAGLPVCSRCAGTGFVTEKPHETPSAWKRLALRLRRSRDER